MEEKSLSRLEIFLIALIAILAAAIIYVLVKEPLREVPGEFSVRNIDVETSDETENVVK